MGELHVRVDLGRDLGVVARKLHLIGHGLAEQVQHAVGWQIHGVTSLVVAAAVGSSSSGTCQSCGSFILVRCE